MSQTTGIQPGLVAPRDDTVATVPSARATHRPDIDGLRAIAVAIVVAFHCGLPWLSGGFVGVDVFFVISGYLIGGIIYEDAVKKRFSYANFYARRIRRIAPALIVVMVATTAFALLFLSPLELKSFSLFAIGTALSVPNIVFLQTMNYFAGNSDLNPLLMTWSLGVEEQFYIIFPMILIGLMRWRWKLVPSLLVIAILSFAMNIWLTAKHPPIAFFALPPRAWELGAGVLLAIWQSTRQESSFALPPKMTWAMRELAPICGVGMIFAAAVCFDNRMQFPGWAALLPVIGTVLIIANQGSINRVLLGSRPLVFIGLLSYSWYLWHWPLLSFSRIASDMPLTWQQAVAVSAASFVISYFSYRYIETPFRTDWRSSPYSTWIGGYLLAILAITLLLVGIYRSDGVPSRVMDRIASTERQAVSDRSNSCLSGYGSVKMNLSADCVVSAGASASVALLGDSHASALRSGMDDYARRNGVGLIQLTKSSCPMLIGVSRVMKDHPRHFQECAQFNQAVLDYVLKSPQIKTVVLAGYWSAAIKEMTADQGYQSTTESLEFTRINSLHLLNIGLRNAVESLRHAGKRVVIVEDVPLLKFNPIKHVATASIATRRVVAQEFFGNLAPDDERTHLVEGVDEGVEDAVSSAATVPNSAGSAGSVDLYSLRDQFCGTAGCQFAQGSRSFYVDQQHLSGAGAKYSLAAMR